MEVLESPYAPYTPVAFFLILVLALFIGNYDAKAGLPMPGNTKTAQDIPTTGTADNPFYVKLETTGPLTLTDPVFSEGPTYLTFRNVSINLDTCEVEYTGSVSAASREFWNAVQQYGKIQIQTATKELEAENQRLRKELEECRKEQ